MGKSCTDMYIPVSYTHLDVYKRQELEWIRRGARARSTKQKAHIQRYEELRDRQAPVQLSLIHI